MLKEKIIKIVSTLGAFAAALALMPSLVSADPPARGMLFLDGDTVRTLVPPASIPHGGRDPLYMVTNGTSAQLGIAGVGPGDAGYHGGQWAIYTVTFNQGVSPYLLTSDEDVQQAEDDGDVTVTRAPALDNRCPVLR